MCYLYNTNTTHTTMLYIIYKACYLYNTNGYVIYHLQSLLSVKH